MSSKSNSRGGLYAGPRSEQPASPVPGGARPYQAPVLTRYGDVRGLTLGGSPGNQDSGGEFNFNFPT